MNITVQELKDHTIIEGKPDYVVCMIIDSNMGYTQRVYASIKHIDLEYRDYRIMQFIFKSSLHLIGLFIAKSQYDFDRWASKNLQTYRYFKYFDKPENQPNYNAEEQIAKYIDEDPPFLIPEGDGEA